jgi:hypothetical protein
VCVDGAVQPIIDLLFGSKPVLHFLSRREASLLRTEISCFANHFLALARIEKDCGATGIKPRP